MPKPTLPQSWARPHHSVSDPSNSTHHTRQSLFHPWSEPRTPPSPTDAVPPFALSSEACRPISPEQASSTATAVGSTIKSRPNCTASTLASTTGSPTCGCAFDCAQVPLVEPDSKKQVTPSKDNYFRTLSPATLICLFILLVVSVTQITAGVPFHKFVQLVKVRIELPRRAGNSTESTPTNFKKTLEGNVTIPSISYPFDKRARALLIQNSFFLAKKGSKRRQAVIVTVASYDIREMVENLQCFIRQTTSQDAVLFSLDYRMHDYAIKKRIPSIPFYDYARVMRRPGAKANVNGSSINLKTLKNGTVEEWNRARPEGMPALWGTRAFSSVSNTKLEVVYQVLRHGFDVLLTDVDIVWCVNMRRAFNRFLLRYPYVDMFIQSNRASDEKNSGQVNTGFYYAKSNAGMLEMFKMLSEETNQALRVGQDDQSFFHYRICGKTIQRFTPLGAIETMCVWKHGKVRVFFLPLKRFPNGLSDPSGGRRVGALPPGFYRDQCASRNVSIWHVNWVSGNMKRAMLNRQRVWIRQNNGSCEKI